MVTGGRERRGVSEFAGVAILVAVTVLATASVGVVVLVNDADTSGAPDADFRFEYVDQSSVLLVNHDRGDPVDAGNLTLRSRETEIGWEVVAGTNETTPVVPGDTVQLSRNNAWDRNVNSGDRVRVVYAPSPGNETVLATWDG